MRNIIGLLAFVFTSAVLAQGSAHYTELTVNGGQVNWTTGKVSAEGYGLANATNNTKAAPLLACRAAVVDAQRNLLESTQGVRVTATTVINNYMLGDDTVKSSIEGTIRGAKLIAREPDNTGGCRVVLEMELAGNPSQAVYKYMSSASNTNTFNFLFQHYKDWQPSFFAKAYANDQVVQQKPDWEIAFDRLSKRLALIESRLLETKKQVANGIVEAPQGPTGLVVDARGSNFIPSLNPKIRKLRGGVVYPNMQDESASRFLERGQLVSLFAKDVDFAIQHPQVGNRPLLVKALRTYGDTRTEIVLSQEYAERITELDEQGFFKQAGVLIVLD